MLKSWKREPEETHNLARDVFNLFKHFNLFNRRPLDGGIQVDATRRAHFLAKAAEHIVMLNIGNVITTEEARELERLGYGSLRGGDTGLFWLFPAGYDAARALLPAEDQEAGPEQIGRRAGRRGASAQPDSVQGIKWVGGAYKRRKI